MQREEKLRMEAAALCNAIIEGYEDVIAGRMVEFKGDLRATLKEIENREKLGWRVPKNKKAALGD